MSVNLRDRPTFTFGNGRRARVSGRATFQVEAKGNGGTFDVHGIEAEGVPILMSIDSLEKMGATIDFGTGRAIYKKLCPKTSVQLEKASSGHLLMDLAADLYKDAVEPGPEDTALRRLAGVPEPTGTAGTAASSEELPELVGDS